MPIQRISLQSDAGGGDPRGRRNPKRNISIRSDQSRNGCRWKAATFARNRIRVWGISIQNSRRFADYETRLSQSPCNAPPPLHRGLMTSNRPNLRARLSVLRSIIGDLFAVLTRSHSRRVKVPTVSPRAGSFPFPSPSSEIERGT